MDYANCMKVNARGDDQHREVYDKIVDLVEALEFYALF